MAMGHDGCCAFFLPAGSSHLRMRFQRALREGWGPVHGPAFLCHLTGWDPLFAVSQTAEMEACRRRCRGIVNGIDQMIILKN